MTVFSWKTGNHAAQIAEIAAHAEFALLVDREGRITESSLAAHALLGESISDNMLWSLTQESPEVVHAYLLACSTAQHPLSRVLHFRVAPDGFEGRICMGSPLAGKEVLLICRPRDGPPGLGERIQAKLMALNA